MPINPAVPADDDIVSQYPAAERAMRGALRHDHAANGRHERVTLVDREADTPSGIAGTVTIWQEDGQLFQRVGTGAATVVGVTPIGGIIMWSGALGTEPEGWSLCDGTNGTPDLRNRFILAAGQPGFGFGVGTTGGAETHTHGGGATQPHTLTGAEIPSHTHLLQAGFSTSPLGNAGGASVLLHRTGTEATQAAGGGGSHTHGIAAVDHKPPFFVLAFIMFTG
jgi:microcystin-dependent protein